MAPHSSMLPFHPLSNPKEKSVSFPIIPTKAQGLMLIVSDWLSRDHKPISEPITVARGMWYSHRPLVSCPVGLRMDTGWFPQRRMGVLLAKEGTMDTGPAQLQASSFAVEQGRLIHQGDH